MLTITIPATSLWDPQKEEFIDVAEQKYNLEYSLVAIARWESKWNKPFLTDEKRTNEEALSFIQCMAVNEDLDDLHLLCLTQSAVNDINKYIQLPMTAAWFSENAFKSNKKSNEQVTTEIVYYWMQALQIPFIPCETWHFNRLMAYIKTCDLKNRPAKKMKPADVLKSNAAINAARRQQLNTKG